MKLVIVSVYQVLTRRCTTVRDSEGHKVRWVGLVGLLGLCGWWSCDQWVMRFQKIFGLHGVERRKVEKWSGQVGSLWVRWVCVGDGWVDSGSVDSGYHKLWENVWFIWSKTSYSEDKWRCHRCGTNKQTNKQQGKIGLLSFWSVISWVSQY